MKKYEVIALSVGGMANKIFKSKEVVREDQFKPGRAEELVLQGFLKPLEVPLFDSPVAIIDSPVVDISDVNQVVSDVLVDSLKDVVEDFKVAEVEKKVEKKQPEIFDKNKNQSKAKEKKSK